MIFQSQSEETLLFLKKFKCFQHFYILFLLNYIEKFVRKMLIRSVFDELLTPKQKTKRKTKTIGECLEMCPKQEINFRIQNHLIHPMETDFPFIQIKRSQRKAILSKMVKEYSRPAADKKLNLKIIRPFSTLKISIDYLLKFVF